MGVNLYRSTDGSAPSLTGQTGSLVALLDAILVNGYGTQPAAGWTIAYTGTSKRDYKQGAGSNGYYLDVDDSGPGGGSYREARLRGYETMSALATGTQAFPTSGQSSFGVVCRKSTTADTTARPWYCIADATCFHLFVDTGDATNPSYSMGVSFGDIFSYKSGDTNNTVLIGRIAENSGSFSNEALPMIANAASGILSATTFGGQYIDRSWTGVGGSLAIGKLGSLLAVGGGSNYSTGGYNYSCMGDSFAAVPYPNGADNALELSPLWIFHANALRGYLKGLWAPCHRQPLGHGDTFSGSGNMAGKSFIALNVAFGFTGYYNHNGGQIVAETSNTWS
ncbi:hypothetical protein [Burkholderia pseudomallei]|uniref:hypothetical protein n=1 Tax=Burkholderia pseudomallei TaxID=28450 RepID=UPI000F22B6FD|nr:hypothetical protein [Burkholderia pseudomallei]CAJ3240707.1 Uncharacterised protein [Burkholderia pseudomallei]CAJ8249228.1 Uncharacterised protein [Burkholderia pseudomallei]VBF29275.1 Uncharacterised protein [Burkholderia pseudomallei]